MSARADRRPARDANDADAVRRRQLLLFSVIAAVALVAIAAWLGTGAAVANTGLGDIGRAGLGSGASSAGQKVADYMIRRAEQYQPVVQLQAGTKVTLVFLEGARIDGRAPAPTQTAQQEK